MSETIEPTPTTLLQTLEELQKSHVELTTTATALKTEFDILTGLLSTRRVEVQTFRELLSK